MFEQGSPLEEAFWNVAASEEARRRLVEALHYELLGPEREDEELSESPVTRYVTGLLAPFGTGVLPTEQDVSLAAGDDDNETGALEGAPPMSQAMTPSSIGISFLVSDGVEAVMTEASWGEYERLKSDEKDAPDKGSEQAGLKRTRRLLPRRPATKDGHAGAPGGSAAPSRPIRLRSNSRLTPGSSGSLWTTIRRSRSSI